MAASSSQNTVLGKYRITREIARSNDIVYEALDPKMNRRVAVKELQLPLHLAGTQKRERVERFYREAKAAGTLAHPNIVTIHEVGQENDRHFLVMEYLEGQSLRDILQLQGALPLKETVEIALQLCDALSYAHAHGVVHRDVKPDNVHILPGGIIKLTDFGIARITAEPSITSQGQVFGTPSYMSPEQVASHTVDHRTDLFSLGITLYEMLTGRKPFVGDSVITITYNIMNTQPPMPVGVPAAMQAILQKALSKDPVLRYQSASQMAADLRAEKFALANAVPTGLNPVPRPVAFAPPTTLTPAPSTPPLMNTGVVPSHISGLPAMNAAPSPQPPPPSERERGSNVLPLSPSAGGGPQSQAIGAGSRVGEGANGRRELPSPAAPTQIVQAVGGLPAARRRRPPGRLLLLTGAAVAAVMVLLLAAVPLRSALRVRQTSQQAQNLSLAASRAWASGDLSTAEQNYAQARQIAAPGTQAWTDATQGLSAVITARGQRLLQTGDRSGAALAFTQAATINPRNAAAHQALGDLRWQGRDWAEAIDAWKQAISVGGTSQAASDARRNATRALRDRARDAVRRRDRTTARAAWQQVQQINPPGSAAAADAAAS